MRMTDETPKDDIPVPMFKKGDRVLLTWTGEEGTIDEVVWEESVSCWDNYILFEDDEGPYRLRYLDGKEIQKL